MFHFVKGGLLTATEGALTLPSRKWRGFALGPMCDHDRLDLVNLPIPGGRVELRPGIIVPFDGRVDFAPRIERVRYLRDSLTGLPSSARSPIAHVMGLTCDAELALPPPMRTPYICPRTEFTVDNSGGAGQNLYLEVPVAGRSHYLVSALTSSADVYIRLAGRRYYGLDGGNVDETELEAATVLTADTVWSWHEGGTNEAESFDTFCVYLEDAAGGSAKTCNVYVEAWGEMP